MSTHPKVPFSDKVIFAVISLLSIWLIASSIVVYLIQDSSPKQTTALLRIVVFLIVIAFVYFAFLKFRKYKFEDMSHLLFRFEGKEETIALIITVVLIITICIFYKVKYENMVYNAAYSQLMNTLNGIHRY